MGFMSMDEARSLRLQALIAACVDVQFGALFKVSESVWKEAIGTTYDQMSNRKGHPGCSLRKYGASLGPIPLLHGTTNRSRNRESVPVRDVYGKPHTTWFGGLDPIPMGLELWQNKSIVPSEKRRLDADEIIALQGLCSKKGW